MKRGIMKRIEEGMKDDSGQMMIIGAIIFLAVIIGGVIIILTILMNLETVGKGILYIAMAFGVIIGISAIAKRLLSENNGRTDSRKGVI